MIVASPIAKVGAPPVRLNIVFSPIFFASSVMSCGFTTKPQLDIVRATLTASVPIAIAGELIAKYKPGCKIHAAIRAIIATADSISIEP